MTSIKVFEKPKLKNPILIEGLPGVGNIGRVAAGYMISELKAKKFAHLYSEHFFPFVMLHDNYEIKLLKNEFYYWKAKFFCSFFGFNFISHFFHYFCTRSDKFYFAITYDFSKISIF